MYKQPIPAQRIQLLTINMPILAGQECILKPPNNHWQASLNPSTLTQLLSIKKLVSKHLLRGCLPRQGKRAFQQQDHDPCIENNLPCNVSLATSPLQGPKIYKLNPNSEPRQDQIFSPEAFTRAAEMASQSAPALRIHPAKPGAEILSAGSPLEDRGQRF